ncbi:MAG: hypothetical protein R3E13_12100 [Alphaproteobacteria bacterium]
MRVFVFSSLLVLALTGCKPVWDPTFMPSGYAYHSSEYKAPTGPEAADIGYEYSVEQNAAVLESWRHAAADLLLRAKANDVLPAGPVYLTTDLETGTFQVTFETSLRHEMLAQGITVATGAEDAGAQALFYSAYDPEEEGRPETTRPYNDEAHHPNKDGDHLSPYKTMNLVLGQVHDGILTQKVAAFHEVPSYGFKPAGYVELHERPLEQEALNAQQEEPADGYNQ